MVGRDIDGSVAIDESSLLASGKNPVREMGQAGALNECQSGRGCRKLERGEVVGGNREEMVERTETCRARGVVAGMQWTVRLSVTIQFARPVIEARELNECVLAWKEGTVVRRPYWLQEVV